MKQLLLRCDDFGCARGANLAILELAEAGLTLNASVLICGPEARTGLEALAKFAPRVCLGIHVAVASEWDRVKWGPVGKATRFTELVDANGHFHPGLEQASSLSHEIIVAEARAQIEEALSWGIPFSYLDEHMNFNWMHDIQSHHMALASEFNLIYQPSLPSLPPIEDKPDDLILQWSRRLHEADAEPHLLVTHRVLADESTHKLSNSSSLPGKVAQERAREFQALWSASWLECLRREKVELITYRNL